MPVIVVAVLTAKPSRATEIVEAFREVSPLVHAEPGCEIYAAHREQGGDAVVMIERWTTRAHLDAHAAGAALERLNELLADVLVRPYDVWFLDAVPLGDTLAGLVWPDGTSAPAGYRHRARHRAGTVPDAVTATGS